MKNISHIPENIKKAGKKLPYQVPENYFEELAGRIQDRLHPEKASFSERFLLAVRPHLAVAAMIAGMVIAGYTGFRMISNPAEELYSWDEVAELVDYYADQFEEKMLISALIESDIELFAMDFSENEEEIIEYLSEGEIDYSVFFEN